MSLSIFGLSLEWIYIICSFGYVLYNWLWSPYKFFEKRGIPYEKPIPIFGNYAKMMLQRESMFHTNKRLYSKWKHERFYGVFEMRNPILVINDPDLIKQITIKDFDYFVNHRMVFDGKDEPLFGNSLFALKDQMWKSMRSILSPSFTGSKMRVIFQILEECNQSALTYLKSKSKSQDVFEIDMKDFFSRFTSDVIASAAFGLNINSLTNDNEFYTMGRKAINFGVWVAIKFFLFANFNKTMKLFKARLFHRRFTDYFYKLVLGAIKQRAKEGIFRPDMIQLLLEAQTNLNNENKNKSDFKKLTDDEVVAQCFIFFLGGYEPTSNLMCFVAHELMINQDVQEKLYNEVNEVMQEIKDDQLTYDILQKMKYLDMVVSETTRKWPVAIMLDRVCTKTYKIYDDKTDKEIQINPGESIWIPVLGIHYDENYFPNPEKFDPERFNEENKKNINQFTFLPFGAGPRNCIGNRFALMETKAIIFRLIKNFKLEPSPKSSIPIKLSKKAGFQLIPEKGFWLNLVSRN